MGQHQLHAKALSYIMKNAVAKKVNILITVMKMMKLRTRMTLKISDFGMATVFRHQGKER